MICGWSPSFFSSFWTSTIFTVVLGQTVWQSVYDIYAIHQFPLRSSNLRLSSSCVMNSKPAIGSDIFESISSPQALRIIRRDVSSTGKKRKRIPVFITIIPCTKRIKYIKAGCTHYFPSVSRSEEHTSELQSRGH